MKFNHGVHRKFIARFADLFSTALCLCLLTASTGISFSTSAQQAGNPTLQNVNGEAGDFVIRNARIVTVAGPVIENGDVVIRGGKIVSVGPNAAAPPGAREIDARGLTVFPGMIDLGTSMGLAEISSGAPGTIDTSEVGEMNPNAQAIVAISPHSAHIGVTRVAGVTTVLSLPTGNVISGQAALINLRGATPQEMAVVPAAALAISFPRVSTTSFDSLFNQQEVNITEAIKSRDTQLEQLRKILREAEAYGRAHDAYARDNTLPRPSGSVILAALVPYVRGERPVVFRADREVDIRAAVRFAVEMKLKPIILGGDDAWKVTQYLKEQNVPVILTGVLDLPAREDDYYDTLYENAAKLHRAGVTFCISTGSSGAGVRDLPFHAGMAAAFGLPADEALKATTIYPAKIIGVADRLGTIEPGKIANLVITDGDMLEARTHVRHLFIDGRLVPLVSRHTMLYEQFKDRK
jgi:imidazolonepropionase-like amidohydrolase